MNRGLCALVFTLFAANRALALVYVESSAGLSTPELDGGRTELELADLNGDGQLDLLSIGDHGNPGIGTDQHGIIVWFGDGAGSWDVFQYGDFGYGGIAVGDVNGDGLADVGYGMHHDYSATDLGDAILEVALGDGTGRLWTPWDDGLATSGETYGMFGTDFADVDNDGDLDVGSVSFGCCAGVHVYRNHGNGAWSQSFGFVGGNSRMEFEFGDVDADGNPDFVVGHQLGTVYRGDGKGGFAAADAGLPPAGNGGRRGPDLADADGDGDDEISFANLTGGVEVWRRGPTGSWTPFAGGLPASGSFDGTQFRDMNGDLLADVVAFGGGQVKVWVGNGAGSWFAAAQITVGGGAEYQALRAGGDADHNGLPDRTARGSIARGARPRCSRREWTSPAAASRCLRDRRAFSSGRRRCPRAAGRRGWDSISPSRAPGDHGPLSWTVFPTTAASSGSSPLPRRPAIAVCASASRRAVIRQAPYRARSASFFPRAPASRRPPPVAIRSCA